MDQATLVDRRIDDGHKLLLQLARENFDVAVAFWLKAPEDPWPHLFIASGLVQDDGPIDGYRAMQTSLKKLPGTSVSLTDIKLIGVRKPLAGEVKMLLRKSGGSVPIHIRGGQLADLAFEELYVYPPVGRQKRSPVALGQRVLKRDVEQTSGLDQLLAPLSPQESRALEQIVASGVSPSQADYWVRKKREEARKRPPIPAGTVVNARITAWWGDNPEDDPNPLLLVEAPDGAQGLTFLDHTEPV